jgi:hypothetical protein
MCVLCIISFISASIDVFLKNRIKLLSILRKTVGNGLLPVFRMILGMLLITYTVHSV